MHKMVPAVWGRDYQRPRSLSPTGAFTAGGPDIGVGPLRLLRPG